MRILAITLVGLLLAALPAVAQEGKKPQTDSERLSYSLGVDIGRRLKDQGIPVEPEMLSRGITDAMTDADMALSDDEMRSALLAFQKQRRQEAQQQRAAQAGENQRKGEAFLAENAKKPGVQTTESGLQYKVIERGDGASPDSNDTVVAHYEGKLIDGTTFDSSYERGEPAEFPVNRVIPGWGEAIQLMQEGGKWQVWIPSDLAYGARGAGQRIGPNETLEFQIELIEVKPKEGKAQGGMGGMGGNPHN